jgi:signal transduction histidine kinase
MPQSSSHSPGTEAARARRSASAAASHPLIQRQTAFGDHLEDWFLPPKANGLAADNGPSNHRAIQRALRAERKRIARDIHDYAEQLIVAMMLRLARVEQNPADAKSQCHEVRRNLAELDEGLRRISNGLRIASICNGTLPIILSRLAERWTTDTGIRISVHIEPIEFRDPDGTICAVAAHVAQLMLNNVAKHAACTPQADIRLQRLAGAIALSVEDNGPGFTPPDETSPRNGSGRSGLVYMQERLAEVGGHLVIDSALGVGTKAIAVIPVGGCS